MTRVNLAGDGGDPTPAETAARLAALTGADTAPDNYGLGGVVARFEARIAALLGKEAAVFVPTGTLAQTLALTLLCGTRRRVVVQQDGHLFNDTGDMPALVGGFTLVPLGGGRPAFTAAEFQGAIDRAADLRVASPIGAVVIESPVRRHHSILFPTGDIARIAALARRNGVGLHLDGARLPVHAVWSGLGLAEACAPFDTVYVSLWKMFDCPFGAVLAGPAALLEGVHHDRRRLGGALWQAWPATVLAEAGIDRLEQDWRATRAAAEAVLGHLTGPWRVEPVPGGSHVTRLVLERGDPVAARIAAKAEGLILPAPEGNGFWVKCNPSWLSRAPEDIAAALIRSAG